MTVRSLPALVVVVAGLHAIAATAAASKPSEPTGVAKTAGHDFSLTGSILANLNLGWSF